MVAFPISTHYHYFRYGVIVLGNPRILARHPLWNAFINHMKDHEALMEGPLNNLVQVGK